MQCVRALNHSFSRKDVKTPNYWRGLKLKFNLDYDKKKLNRSMQTYQLS